MVGRVSFESQSLPPGAVDWYSKMWQALDADNIYPNSVEAAASGDLYQIGRVVNVHVTTLLELLRFTGDLRLLDRVDLSMQAARSQLRDTNNDGYLNWRWLHDPSNQQWYGDDHHAMDEQMTHGLIAAVAWAYQANRDLTSPGGVDYGERADFWLAYLKNDFEPKWREREETGGFDYLYALLMHPYFQTIRYFHYMGLLTGDAGYTTESRKLASAITNEFRVVQTREGPAFVWGEGVRSHDFTVRFLQPTIYASYVVQTAQELALEGMLPFADLTFMTRLARTITGFVIDDGDKSFALDVGGHRPILDLDAAPLLPHDPGFARLTVDQWGIMNFGALAAFDTTGTIARVNREVFDHLEDDGPPRRIYMPSAFIIQSYLDEYMSRVVR